VPTAPSTPQHVRPYSSGMPAPSRTSPAQDALGGVGIVFYRDPGSPYLLVKDLVPGGPAFKSCLIYPGDRLCCINDFDLAWSGRTPSHEQPQLPGPHGSAVQLTFDRSIDPSRPERFSATLIRSMSFFPDRLSSTLNRPEAPRPQAATVSASPARPGSGWPAANLSARPVAGSSPSQAAPRPALPATVASFEHAAPPAALPARDPGAPVLPQGALTSEPPRASPPKAAGAVRQLWQGGGGGATASPRARSPRAVLSPRREHLHHAQHGASARSLLDSRASRGSKFSEDDLDELIQARNRGGLVPRGAPSARQRRPCSPCGLAAGYGFRL